MTPLLFYSKRCPHSRRLVEALRANAPPEVLERSLRFVCVDDNIDRLPAEIDRVPALLVPTSAGNRVVFESEMQQWLGMLVARPDAGAGGGQQQAVAPPPSYGAQQQAHYGRGAAEAPVDAFSNTSDDLLCDVSGGGDFAGHLFALPGEEIRIHHQDQDASGTSAGGASGATDDGVLSRIMAARNQEMASVYSQIPMPDFQSRR